MTYRSEEEFLAAQWDAQHEGGTLADIALPQHCACGQLLQDVQELERHVERGCWRAA